MALRAYMLIEVQLGMTEEVVEEVGRLEGVKSVDRVIGPCDVIAVIEVSDFDALSTLIKQIPDEIGILKVATLVKVR